MLAHRTMTHCRGKEGGKSGDAKKLSLSLLSSFEEQADNGRASQKGGLATQGAGSTAHLTTHIASRPPTSRPTPQPAVFGPALDVGVDGGSGSIGCERARAWPPPHACAVPSTNASPLPSPRAATPPPRLCVMPVPASRTSSTTCIGSATVGASPLATALLPGTFPASQP